MNFKQLARRIRVVHDELFKQATKAVNLGLTLRNWFIGCHLHEYELSGEDRSRYGERVFDIAADELTRHGMLNCNRRQLHRYRDFYRAYPEIVGTLSPQFRRLLPGNAPAGRVGTSSPQSEAPALPPQNLVDSLSYSHLELLVAIDDPFKRAFYEIESVRGTWSVRELKRQIASLYYERSGLSHNKKKLATMVEANVERASPAVAIRDPYVFEFLGIAPREVMPESQLERALLDKLEDFLLELGRGFCFEARQRRILVGDEHYYVDLVFYHRILKCHVLIELKSDGFTHEYLGQLNTYVSWYRENEMSPGDNLPVGILLCTEKNHALVKYALAGMNSQLFVSKYQIELPNETHMRAFIESQLQKTRAGGIKESREPEYKDSGGGVGIPQMGKIGRGKNTRPATPKRRNRDGR